VLDPLARYLRARGARIRLSTACTSLVPRSEGGFEVNGEHFDHVILASHAQAARALIESSGALQAAAPRLTSQLRALPRGQRYAVWHLWLDRDVRHDVPVFVSTERQIVLDAVALCHRVRPATREPAVVQGARAMLELHSYAVPDGLTITELRAAFMDELEHYFPELRGAHVVRESLQVRDDFTAFHVGAAGLRPETQTELPGLFLAGDWVRLPCPAMLMEAAYTSGLLATNAVLACAGLRAYPVESVPRRGLLYELRRAKVRRRAQRARARAVAPR
jgi:isorenieratene synthase